MTVNLQQNRYFVIFSKDNFSLIYWFEHNKTHTPTHTHISFALSLLTVKSSGNAEPCTVSSCILHLQAYLPTSQSQVVRPDEADYITAHLVSSCWPHNTACIWAERIFRERYRGRWMMGGREDGRERGRRKKRRLMYKRGLKEQRGWFQRV